MNLTIRDELPEDIDAIDAVTVAAFIAAPHTSHTEQFIVKALRNAGALAISLAAECDGVLVAHVAVSPISISDGTTAWFGLGPISVSPAYQRHGIGSRLMRDALCRLEELGAAGCVLLGDPAYYRRFGFRPEATLALPEVPPEYFLAMPFCGPLPQGVVTYHSAFCAQS